MKEVEGADWLRDYNEQTAIHANLQGQLQRIESVCRSPSRQIILPSREERLHFDSALAESLAL